jgi:predicted nucleic acid-binding protein
MVCLDTDILIGLLKGDQNAIDAIRRLQDEEEPLKTTAINAYELLKGAQVSSRQKENLNSIKELLSSIPVLPLSQEPCEEASKIYEKLRREGHTIGEFDILIASIAILEGDPLITRDGHFQLIKDLSLRTW